MLDKIIKIVKTEKEKEIVRWRESRAIADGHKKNTHTWRWRKGERRRQSFNIK